MIGILVASFLVFGLAKADTRENQAAQEEEKEKKQKAEERFRAEQSIKRALRDQERGKNSITPLPSLPKPPPPKK